MLVRVGRLAEALSHLEEVLAVSRDLAAQDAGEEAQVPLLTYALPSSPILSYPLLSSCIPSSPILTYPHLSSPILSYAHVCSRMLTYAGEEAQAVVDAAYTNVGIVCNRMWLLERVTGAHFTCFTGTQVHILTQKARAAEAHRGAPDVRIRLRGQAHLETADFLNSLVT